MVHAGEMGGTAYTAASPWSCRAGDYRATAVSTWGAVVARQAAGRTCNEYVTPRPEKGVHEVMG